MITQTFKMQFQCVMWITRHSSIWIANTSIHCSLPSQLRKLAKSGSWHCHLQWQCTMYSVMRDIPDARKVPMERGWVALYWYATCKFLNLLTLEQWAFEYGLPLFWYALYRCKLVYTIATVYITPRERPPWNNYHMFWFGLLPVLSRAPHSNAGGRIRVPIFSGKRIFWP